MAKGPMSSILVTIRITVRIREELPQFYYAGVRRRYELSECLACHRDSLLAVFTKVHVSVGRCSYTWPCS